MNTTPAVLIAVAKELAEQAKTSLPKIRSDEKILREWFENGIFYRETTLQGEVFRSQYDFRQRKSRRVAVVKE